MPIDKELVKKKLSFLDKHLTAIENMSFDEDEFVSDADIHDLVVFRLQQAVETCIDIAVHIISQSDVERKETSKDAFLALGELRIIDISLSKNMALGADFRNRVVHGYNNFDFQVLYKDYKNNIKDLRLFGGQVLKSIT